MLAEPAAQHTLLKLADLDTQIARLQHTARSLPQHQAIAELMAARENVTDALVAATTEANDATIAVEKAEADLAPVKARRERNKQRVADGSVSDGKVLASLNEEIAHLDRRVATLEDEQLELMSALEEATARRDKLAEQKRAVENKLRQAVAQRDQQVQELSQEAKALSQQRPAIGKNIPEPLLALYERLRSSTGLGAAALRRGRCGGCQLELTIADLDACRKAPANEVLRCAECDRILVRTAESGL